MIDLATRTAVTVTQEGDSWFRAARSAWNSLLAASRANPLFLGWDWQYAWWRNFGASLDAQPAILVARDTAGEILGVAPFLVRESAARRPWRIVQMAPIGNVWRQNVGEVTEHVDWIVQADLEGVVQHALVEHLASMSDWDELLLSYASSDSISATALTDLAITARCYVRGEKPLEYYSVDTTQPFGEFARRLGGHTRQRMQQRRKLLGSLGSVDLLAATVENLSAQLDKLDELSRRRWGTGFSSGVRGFYEDIASTALAEDRLHFSTLEVNGQPISAQFDIRAGDAVYNIRSAIDTRFHRKLSPGLLHLGYAIEEACSTAGVFRYELLAGRGKQTDFKRDIADATGNFISQQLIRRPYDKLLFKTYDALFHR